MVCIAGRLCPLCGTSAPAATATAATMAMGDLRDDVTKAVLMISDQQASSVLQGWYVQYCFLSPAYSSSCQVRTVVVRPKGSFLCKHLHT